MTAVTAARQTRDGVPAPQRHDAGQAAGAAGGAPVIVLTYAHSGAGLLRSLLARHPDLACTSGTGVLPLCQQAATAWRRTDGLADGPLPALAVASTRNLAATIITAVLSAEGKRRWCEISTAEPAAAETFLQLFPATRVLCLQRSWPDVVYAALHASPWGLAGQAIAPFVSAHPASAAAALTAHWTAHAGRLLAFERANPGACRRVRYEDLTGGSCSGLHAFLGLDDPGPAALSWAVTDAATTADAATGAGAASAAGADDPPTPFPTRQIPPGLLDRASSLMNELGYPPPASMPGKP
jgi:Sulfotransferase family